MLLLKLHLSAIEGGCFSKRGTFLQKLHLSKGKTFSVYREDTFFYEENGKGMLFLLKADVFLSECSHFP